MKMKYLTIFLGIVLCLMISSKSAAQNCISFEYDVNGNQIARVFQEGCENEKNAELIMSVESETVDDFSLYPNPVEDLMTLILPNFQNNNCAEYTIVDVNGNQCRYGEFSSEEIVIDIGDLMSGVYVITVEYQDVTYSRTIVKL